MISAYIKELLKNQNRVIVPDLGAFLKKNDNPEQVYFNEFLRFNDGLLVDHISEMEKIDKVESAKRIKNFVSELNNILQNKQPYELKGIGTLSMDAEDKIQLKGDLLKVYEPEEEPKQESFPETNKFVEFEVKSESQNETTKIHFEEPSSTHAESQPVTIKSQLEDYLKQNPKQGTINQGFSKAPEMETPPVQTEKSSNRNFLWIGILIIILLMVLSWFYFIKPRMADSKKEIAADTTSVQPPVAAAEPVKNTEIKTTEKQENKKPEIPAKKKAVVVKKSVVNTNGGNNKYFVVVGCFAMESNADELVKKLVSKGFSAEKFTRVKELYLVSIASYPDISSAQNDLGKFQAQGYQDCWIKKN
jgi:hypothetical protein